MLADQFLERWITTSINSGIQDADVPRLANELEVAAARDGISREAMEMAAGQSLQEHLKAAIREAIGDK